ncbi:MAG: DUF3575 domain-containing protein [Prevotella sp.]|nr:DUF3575 domain-containing protein [Prevotella sp.]
MKKIFLTIVWAVLSIMEANAQMLSANVDALWLATLSPNLGFELVVGERSTISLNGMMMSKPLGKDVKLYALQPEYRYYFSGRPMYREFIGFGAIGGTYDITWSGKKYDGTAIGGGLTFGYVMPLTRRLNIDFHAGFGFVHYKQKEYFVGDQYDADYSVDNAQRTNAKGFYFIPTRIGVSLTYIIR